MWLNSLKSVENSCIIVTATYDYPDICKEIQSFFPLAKIKSLDEVIDVCSWWKYTFIRNIDIITLITWIREGESALWNEKLKKTLRV